MYKNIEIGKYFAPGDLSSSYNDVKKFSNLITDHADEIACYSDSSKTKNRSDLKLSGELVYLHGSLNSTSAPYFEIDNNHLPLYIQFNMRFTKFMGDLGDVGWFFYYDDVVTNGAFGIKCTDIIKRKLVTCFTDHSGGIVCPLTESMLGGEWFKVNLTYYDGKVCTSINNRIIGTSAWVGDPQDKFQINPKSNIYYADISDITITRSYSVPAPDKPFDITFSNNGVTNGATTVTARATSVQD